MTVSPPPPSSAPAGWRILPQGDRCLIVWFGDRIDAGVGRACLAGVTDVVPSFAAVAVHYRPGPDGAPGYSMLAAQVERLLAGGIPVDDSAGREMEIPVCYGGEHGPDLEEATRAAGLTPEALVALHGAPGSMVYMLGFAPGHSYIGVHDARLDLPRRATPRTAVPAGSVAIANRQTVIYPARLPGGWNIIGATPLNLFDPGREPAALLQPGDRIRFVPIDAAEFDRLREAQ